MMTEVSPALAWLISAVLVEAAVIDGRQLRVPNWLTFNFVAGGLIFGLFSAGPMGLLWSLGGAGVGLISLLPLYAIAGMGAGDVKLMAGLGAWMGPTVTFGAFVATALAGGLLGLTMVIASGDVIHHWVMLQTICCEIVSIRNPARLAELAAQRKKSMRLLPYGIPIAVGSITYFAWIGLYF
jgi:prepilin peptidase CpaA